MTLVTDHNSPDFFCSLQSRANNEDTMGSAPTASMWFMLEYGGRWGAKAFDESDIPDHVKLHINEQLADIGKARLLIIKQREVEEDHIRFFAAYPDPSKPKLFRFQLSAYEGLLDLDLGNLARGGDKYSDQLLDETVFMVCTNGLRDKCCARNGVPAYQALSEEYGDIIWQSTHHGGHRFSANMLAMPYALSYGRMDMRSASETVRQLLKHQMPIENLRGRSVYNKVEQAAEALLRSDIVESDPKSLMLSGSKELIDDLWEIIFQHSQSDRKYAVQINRKLTDTMAYVSCIGDKQAPQIDYQLVDHKIS